MLQEHLFLVCELLRANLYEFQKYNRDSGNPPYFILQRVQSIARQACTLSCLTVEDALVPALKSAWPAAVSRCCCLSDFFGLTS